MNQPDIIDQDSTTGGPGTEMRVLSAYMSAARGRALPAEAAEHAKHHLLDSLAKNTRMISRIRAV